MALDNAFIPVSEWAEKISMIGLERIRHYHSTRLSSGDLKASEGSSVWSCDFIVRSLINAKPDLVKKCCEVPKIFQIETLLVKHCC